MNDLVEWLRAQLDERARAARAACHGGEGRWHQTDPDREHGRIEDESGEVVTYDEGSPSGYQAAHIALHDPATELGEVEAQLRILDEHYIIERKVNWTDGEGEDRQTHLPVCVVCVPKYSYIGTRDQAVGPCETVKLLALPLADRPGYRSEWAPR